jgi:hypothetical protein
MDLVQYHLILVLFRWCGLKPPSYGPSSILSDMWSGVSAAPYLWTGAKALKKKLNEDEFFHECPDARDLDLDRFAEDGDIQTVSDLYFALTGCGVNGEFYATTNIFDAAV